MKKKIDIAEILKDCPRGMELDCTIYDDVTLDSVVFESEYHYENTNNYPIKIVTKSGFSTRLTKYGQNVDIEEAKCVIFPKGKTTWEGFVPCKFKAGDVLVSETGNIVLFSHINSEDFVHYHCIIPTYGSFRIEKNTSVGVGRYYDCVLANEQQRQKIYNKIKYSGYKYNQNTNKLEKLVIPRFKVGDRVKCIHNNNQYDIKELTDTHYTLVEVEYKFKYTEPIINDKDWELVPNKFDVNTLKPFESKVLVRSDNHNLWKPAIFGFLYEKGAYMIGGTFWRQVIPYEGNEHLSGTTNDCDEFYRVWEK